LPPSVTGNVLTRERCRDRQGGYVARYNEHDADRLWLMCKTAYCILIERAAKYADSQGRLLRVFFEETGKAEDRALIAYH
jgi:hypothetical protein